MLEKNFFFAVQVGSDIGIGCPERELSVSENEKYSVEYNLDLTLKSSLP